MIGATPRSALVGSAAFWGTVPQLSLSNGWQGRLQIFWAPGQNRK
jgi:hypothetical protein